MRRGYSILTVLAVVFSTLMPIWAAEHVDFMPRMAACHRTPLAAESASAQHHATMHHCHGMAEESTGTPSSATMTAAQDPDQCPMNCCTQASPRTGAAVAAVSYLPLLVVTDNEFHFVPVTFTSAGFSSYTDRGPPAV